MEIKKAKVIKIGNSYGVTIPKSFINNEIINVSEEYDITLAETKKGEQNGKKQARKR